MDNVSGLAGALGLILLGLAFFVVVARRRSRAIAAAGYVPAVSDDPSLAALSHSLFAQVPTEIHRKDEATGPSWLVFVDAAGSDDAGCVMAVYPLEQAEWPPAMLVRSGRRIPKVFQHLSDGLFKSLVPLADGEMAGLDGSGWFAYKASDHELPQGLKARLIRAVAAPRAGGLLGIAIVALHLVIWSETGRVTALLASAPGVRAALTAAG